MLARITSVASTTRYNRTRNFGLCGHAESKKTQKFVFRFFAQQDPKATSAARDCCCATADFYMVDDARKAAIADADNPKIGPVDSITIDPIGERWVKGESLVRTGSGWERRREPE